MTTAPTSSGMAGRYPARAGDGSDAALYQVLRTHDLRFDGRLFVGVTSTGVYCRPVCRVKLPRPENCRYFAHAAAAEARGFRPCLRCRPELAPGLAPIDMPSRLAWAAAQRIEAGALEEGNLAGLAARLGITDRHLRRVFGDAFGVSPVAWAQTRRLLLAKQLLTDTRLPITEIALAAGFGSLRRFHAAWKARYGLEPGRLRRDGAGSAAAAAPGVCIALAYRPPLDWPRLLAFLAARAVPGVEQVDLDSGQYRRTLRLAPAAGGRVTPAEGPRSGWIVLRPALDRDALWVEVSAGLQSVLPAVLAAVRRLADLDADPQAVLQGLGGPAEGRCPAGGLAAAAPGLRVPGGVDGFELAARAVLGQQVSVAAARTLAGRLVQALGEGLPGADAAEAVPAGLTRLFPTPAQVAAAAPEQLGALGIVRQRVAALQALARAVAEGRLDLGPSADVPATVAQLEALPGIGAWTAQYIALRALAWPDAWPRGDVVLQQALGLGRGARAAAQAEALAQAWRPWRGYAALHLWRRAAEGAAPYSFTESTP